MLNRRDFVRQTASLATLIAVDQSIAASTGVRPKEKIIRYIQDHFRNIHKPLRLLHPEGCAANIQPIVEQFNALTGLQVQLIKGSLDDIASEVRLAESLGATDTGFDIALPATFSIPDLASGGFVKDLSSYAEKHEPKLFSNEMLYALGDRYLGKFFGYQADGDAYLMFYNNEMLEDQKSRDGYAQKFGIPLELPKTWQELDRQMAWFHQPDIDLYGGSLYRNQRYIGWEFWSRLHGNGKYPMDENFDPQLTTAESISALESLVEATNSLEPSVAENGLFANFESYAKGNKYCNIGWGGTQKYLTSDKSQLRNKLQHSMLPGGTHPSLGVFQTPYFNWGWNYVVLSKAKNPELAYLFTLFASLPDTSSLAVQQQNGFFDPHQISHYDNPRIREIYTDGFLDIHRSSLEQSMPDFQVIAQERYMRILSDAVYAADRKLVSAEYAMQAVTTKWQEITEEVGRNKQTEQWKLLRESYPQHLSEFLS